MREKGEQAILYIPEKEAFARRLRFRRARVLGIPPPPKSPEDLETIPDNLTKTVDGGEWMSLRNITEEQGVQRPEHCGHLLWREGRQSLQESQ